MFKNMVRISSRQTYLSKWVIPVVWFGMVILFLGIVVFTFPSMLREQGIVAAAVNFVAPITILVGRYIFFKNTTFDLLEEVYDGGDHIFVRKNGKEYIIPLAEIRNVNYPWTYSFSRVTLDLSHPTPLGNSIA